MTNIEEDETTVLSNKLQSLWLTTHTLEADSVARTKSGRVLVYSGNLFHVPEG